jgi:hypothetical protein
MHSYVQGASGESATSAVGTDRLRSRLLWAADGIEDSMRNRLVMAVVCTLLVGLPLLLVRFPPVTDLPQHVAQIRLFLAAWADPNSGYRIQWFTPYSAAYALLGAAWALSSPGDAGRLALLALAVLWMAALHGLAARRHRPASAAVLASVLFFNQTLYWGFLSFVMGWVSFVVWILVTTAAPSERSGWRDAARQFGAALLLYVSHALWFGLGAVWLLVYGLAHRWPRRTLLWRVCGVAPVGVAALVWYPHLEALGFVSPTVWFTPPLERLSPAWIVDALFGGIYGPSEPLLVALIATWVVAGWWSNRGALRAAVDVGLLWTGLLLVALAFTLPDQYMNTVLFASRWMPWGAILIVLAAPAPRLLGSLQRPLAFATLAVFCLATGLAWLRFERDELSGLQAALAALPDRQRVIGLDLVRDSDVIKGRPFLQTFAYAQVLHGGHLNMSFAGHAPSLVVYRRRDPAPWTPSLEWFAERVRASDLTYFDYALINGSADIHAQALQFPLAPVTSGGRWRLYKVTEGAR